eukprot:TRINITY_DN10955_c0_g2_i1.p1 TRINITY_DN10955_c0_g2~~TRINITY_DN10955_c0_g2_i1.p1  ORF type:complete len:544 (+),score=161.56 TRINITY_DN10955_c0_g2_i1:85-1632(+)
MPPAAGQPSLHSSGDRIAEQQSRASESISEADPVATAYRLWSLWQDAMEEGWVADFAERYFTDDVALEDSCRPRGSVRFEGRARIAAYYDRVLEKLWGCSSQLTWSPHSVTRSGQHEALAIFAIAHSQGDAAPQEVFQEWHITFSPQGRIRLMQVSPAAAPQQQQQRQVPCAPPWPREHHLAAALQRRKQQPQQQQQGEGTPDAAGRRSPPSRLTAKRLPPSTPPVQAARHIWQTWLTAMAEGCVTEWVAEFCSPDMVFTDYIPDPSAPRRSTGHDAICHYYNKVVQRRWGAGRITWVAESFVPGSAPRSTAATFEIIQDIPGAEGAPERRVRSRQMWYFAFDPVGRIEGCSACLIAQHGQLPAPLSPVSSDASPPTRSSSPRGTALPAPPATGSSEEDRPPPCGHNHWDNVRVKRGWVVLRCRECSAQWRRRPQSVDRCPFFGRANHLGQECTLGAACPKIHISFSRKAREEVLRKRREARTAGGGAPPSAAEVQDSDADVEVLYGGPVPGGQQ